jgi:putative peptidoglycan lipid II flippase
MSDDRRRDTRHALIFGAGTLLSRLLGLVRDVLLARLIPLASLDAFIVAFRLPNMLRDLVGEGASNAAFVPVFSETLEKKDPKEFREAVSAALSAMLLILGMVTLLGVLIAPLLPQWLGALEPITGAEAHAEGYLDLMSSLTRWTFPYIFFIGLAVFMMGALFSVGHYSTPSWSPALLNVSLIVACLTLRDLFPDPAYALVTGVWLGGISQLAVQYAAFKRHTGVLWPNFRLNHPAVWTIFGLMIPVILGQAAGEVNKLVDTFFAAALERGTVTALFYANRLVQLPLSIFGIATSVAILPTLSRAAARDDVPEVHAILMHGFRQSFFLILPSMLGLIVLADPLVRLLFDFEDDTGAMTATALRLYALGLVGFVGVKVAVAGFYAVQNTRTPVIIASVSMLLNVLLNAALVRPLEYRGLAIATTIAFTINFALLYVLLCVRFGPVWNRDFLFGIGRICLAGLMMGAAAYGTAIRCLRTFDGNALITVSATLTVAIVVYAVMAAVLGIPEFRDTLAAFRRRLG